MQVQYWLHFEQISSHPTPPTTKKDELPQELGDKWVQMWNGKISQAGSSEDLASAVKVFRQSKFRTGKKKGWIRMQIMILDNGFESLVHETLKHLGYQEKAGPAPKGALEREAQRLLDKLRR